MKKASLYLAIITLFAACQNNNNPDTDSVDNGNLSEQEINSDETVEVDEIANDSSSKVNFGKMINEEGAITMVEFEKRIATEDSIRVKIVAVADEVCKKMGCWMNVSLANGESMRVKFKDHSFFVPKDIDGREVVFEGLAFRDVVSVEDQRHYAEDAEKSEEEIAKITEPKTSITFQADGVKLL